MMDKILHGIKWMLLLSKRLLKKPAFTVILLMIPVLAASMSAASEEDHGLVTVAVSCDGERDTVAEEVMQSFEEKDNAVYFKICETPDDAKELVSRGKADAAWILPGKLESALLDFCRYGEEVVTVYEREENSFMALSREVMYGKLFPYMSRINYADYSEDWLGDREGYDESEMLEFYDRMRPAEGESLIEFKTVGGMGQDNTDSNHLKMPIRGLLAILTVLSALASAMTVANDIERGIFSWLDTRRHVWVYHASGLGATLMASAVSVLSLVIAGLANNIFYEILTALLFSACATVFCTFTSLLLGKTKRIAAAIPPLVILLMVFSPVFIRVGESPLQFILPTYSYLFSSADMSYTAAMCIYIAVGFAACCAASAVTRGNGKKIHKSAKK